MKNFYFLPLTFILFFTSACQTAPSSPVNSESIKNTAVAQAWTSVSQTQISSTPTTIPTQENKKQIVLDEVIPLLKMETYDSYMEAHKKLRSFLIENPNFENDEEIQTLKLFASCMASVKLGDNPIYCEYEKINPAYQGVFHFEIYDKLYNSDIVGLRKWMNGYSVHATVEALNSLPVPQIGMSAQQVRNSRWGNPQKINKTTTSNTVSEQWVYSNNRYVYLENNIVIAIQE